MRRIAVFLALVGPLLAHGGLLYACAVCLTGADGAVADAYDWSVLFLMAMPYLVVGSIAGGLAYIYHRAAVKKDKQTGCDAAPLRMAWNQEEKQR
jgi:hypothetical protein